MTSKLIVTCSVDVPGRMRVRGRTETHRGRWVVQLLTFNKQGGYAYGPVLFDAETSDECFDWIKERNHD